MKIILIHPLVVHFPVALWLTSALFDILYLRKGERFHFRAALFLIGLGLLAAVVSYVTGLRDLRLVTAQDVGPAFLDRHRIHQMFALASTLVYAVSFYLRWRRPDLGRGALTGLLIIGAALIAWTGWLGGEIRMVM